MTVYAPSDVRAVAIADSFGGCGEQHIAGDLKPGERWALECPSCELALTSPPLNQHGWASRPDAVSLTPDERRMLESQEKEGSAATAMMVRQLGDTLAQAMRAGQQAVAPVQFAQPTASDITSALKGLPPEELAELLNIAGLAPAAVIASDLPEGETIEIETVEPDSTPAPRAAAKKAVTAKPATKA